MVPDSAPETDASARAAAFAFVASAYTLGEVVLLTTGWPFWGGIALGVGLFATALAVHRFGPRPSAGTNPRLPLAVQIAAAGLLALPIAAEPLLERLLREGFPLEIQLLNGLRFLAVLLVAFGRWPRARKLAAGVSLFLALATAATGDHAAVGWLLSAVSVCGGLWLVCEYRSTDAVAQASGRVVGRVRLRVPTRELLIVGVLLAVAAGVLLAGPKKVILSLGELMPTSGGSGDVDPFARSGVGDGPEEVAGDNARAAGMVDTDRMIEDNRDALVDVVSDLFGPPHKPKKNQERMIAGGLADVIQNHGKLPDNRRPSRDFDTHRQGPKSPRQPTSQAARGLFEVSGRVPLHIRTVAYDRYDYLTTTLPDEVLAAVGGGFAERREAAAMHWLQPREPVALATHADGGDWMRSTNLSANPGWYAENDLHQLKVGDSREKLVPTPALLSRFRINRVDKPDYYKWENDGVLTLAMRRKLPPGVVVHTESRTVAPDELPPDAFPRFGAMSGLPDELAGPLTAMADEWTAGTDPGWPRIASVLSKLRAEYTFDPLARPPIDHPHPALWFLLESRRGPDYLFATAAALLLKAQGFQTRVCLGYYADPARYDPDTDHTPVRADDLHLWPEVRLRDGHWLVIEPTPGYETLPPIRPLSQRLLAWLTGIGDWVVRHWLPLLVVAFALIVLVARRRLIADAVATARVRLFPGSDWREQAIRTARLLDRRAVRANRPREPHQSLSAWAGTTSLKPLAELVEWATFAPHLPAPVSEAEAHAVCDRARREWTLRAFAARVPAHPGVTA